MICRYFLRPEKSSPVSGNRPGENFLSLTCPHCQMCIRIYIFLLKKNKKKQEDKKSKKTKEEKRISVENLTGYEDIVCEFALCTFNLLTRVVNFSWLFI